MSLATRHICILTGERSGDEHAARLVRELRRTNQSFTFSAMGAAALRAEGVPLFIDTAKVGGIMGFVAIVKKLPSILATFRTVKLHLKTTRPDLVVLIDYPDFNLRIAKFAHHLGLKTLYYIPPKLWAWRKGRVELFKRFVDETAVIFPFERDFFERAGYSSVTYVGHPFTQQLATAANASAREAARTNLCALLNVPTDSRFLALFPGSRKGEILSHLALVQGLLAEWKRRFPRYKVVVAATDALQEEVAASLEAANVFVVRSISSIELLQAADGAALKSGTSNLQAAYTDTPCCMFFKTSKVNEWIVRTLVSIKSFSPLNILRGDTVREFLQMEASPSLISDELQRLLFDAEHRTKQLSAYREIRALLAGEENQSIAYVALRLLTCSPDQSSAIN